MEELLDCIVELETEIATPMVRLQANASDDRETL